MTPLESPAVSVQSLSRRYRGKMALEEVSLEIPRGSVFGLVGLNGAGKTTLIRHLTGAMRAAHGSVSVLGQDPTIRPERLMARIGYMTEEDSLPQWMRVSDLIQYCRGVYPNWSDTYAADLCEMFALSPQSRLKSLSKGGRARAALLAAIAHRPELLILDEPSSGLDPIARADILEAIIRTVAEDGRTVLFSSHLLEEIDRVCDHVALLHEGKLLESLSADELPRKYVEYSFRSDKPTSSPPEIPGSFGIAGQGEEWSLLMAANGHDSPPDVAGTQTGDIRFDLVNQRPATLHRWFAGRVQPSTNTSGKRADNDREVQRV